MCFEFPRKHSANYVIYRIGNPERGKMGKKESFIQYLFRYKHREEWFKWIEWVTLTVVVCTAWWKTKNYFVFPMAALCVLYISKSFVDGIGTFVRGYLIQWQLEPWQVRIVAMVMFPIFVLGPLIVLVPLLAGMF